MKETQNYPTPFPGWDLVQQKKQGHFTETISALVQGLNTLTNSFCRDNLHASAGI